MSRTCESCGGPYEAIRASARFCSERCRQRGKRGHILPSGAPPPQATALAGTVVAVTAELERAGRIETYLGAAALALAARIDGSTSVMGFAALVKELRSTMAEAMSGVQKAADPVDELRSRRDAKLAG